MNRAVLSTIESDILQPGVVEAAIRKAIYQLRPTEGESKRDALKADLTVVEAEIAHLTEAIAKGGDIPSLVAAIKEREERRERIEAEIGAAESLERVAQLDLGRIDLDLRDRLTDWQGLLQRQPVQARQILRKLLVGRLTFTPQEGGHLRFTGKASLGRVLEGGIFAKRMVTRAGFEPAAPCLKGRCSARLS